MIELGTIYAVADLGAGVYTVDLNIDFGDGNGATRVEYGFIPASGDAAPVHVELTRMFDAGELTALIQPYVPPTPTPTELKAYTASRRYTYETGGCTWNGHPVATDRDSQSKMMAEFVAISGGLRADPSPWKFADGVFVSLTNVEISAVCLAARNHIAAAFALEAQAVAAINGGTITTIAEIDALFA